MRVPRIVHAVLVVATGLAGAAAAVSAQAAVRVAATAVDPSPSPSPSVSPSPTPSSSPSAAPLYPLPAPPAHPGPCPPPRHKHGSPGRVIKRVPRVPENKVPAPVVLPSGRVADLDPITGTGVWVTVFKGGRIDAPAIVAKASGARMHSIWIRTGGSFGGLYAGSVLPRLLTLAHANGIKVIAWDFPTLSDPVSDARRMIATLAYTSPDGQRVDGVSPDIETKSEGVFLTPRRVQAYLSRITASAGSRPVIATVLRPTDYWWNGPYPYRAEAPYVDAFAPMIYWSCNEPGVVTQQAVDRLRTLRPVHTIGQAYDMGAEGPARLGVPTPLETWRFLDVSQRRGAVGASLYLYSQMRGVTWRTMWGFNGWR